MEILAPFFRYDFQKSMKNLVKTGIIAAAVIAFASCQKTEFDSVVPATEEKQQTFKAYHVGSEDLNGNLLADRDKCKKCHTSTAKAMGLDLTAPFMADNRYSSIEELVNNYDFVNNVHLPAGAAKANQSAVTEEQKTQLINYLKSLESETKR
jgi:hypothetical protein